MVSTSCGRVALRLGGVGSDPFGPEVRGVVVVVHIDYMGHWSHVEYGRHGRVTANLVAGDGSVIRVLGLWGTWGSLVYLPSLAWSPVSGTRLQLFRRCPSTPWRCGSMDSHY